MTDQNADREIAGIIGALPVGARLGKYEIVERIGAGGQSIVYKALDPLLDRHVAIKQVAGQLAADDRFIQRFREVTQQLAKLRSEHIVTIHDLIDDERGLFIVMEFVEGHTIETTLATNEGPVEPKAVLQLIWRIASGLAAIHQAGIIHRDVKPGNIIVGEGLRVKITDFGVAAPAGAAASMRLGTTKYMAPELFAGKTVDVRSDIYSLGMITYEMLLGRAKFNEVFQDIVRDPHSESLRWMKWHSSVKEKAPRLSKIDETIPPALSAIVAKMLAKNPDDRFDGAEALGKEIRASFSPRRGPGRGKRRKKRRASVEAEGRGPHAPALGTSNGADELTVAAVGEPITAEIPTLPMTLGRKLIIGGSIGGVLLALLVGLIVYSGMSLTEKTRKAKAEYDVAWTAYKDAGKADTIVERRKKYAAALEGFKSITANYKKLDIVKKAEVMAALCAGYGGAMDEAKTADAQRAGQDARSFATDLQRGKGELRDWAKGALAQELNSFDKHFRAQRDFRKHISRSDQDRAGGDLNAAEDSLGKAGKVGGLTRDQKELVSRKKREIRVAGAMQAYRQEIDKGDRLVGLGQPDDAKAAYSEAIKVIAAAVELLGDQTHAKLKQAAETKISNLTRKVDYDTALTEAKKLAEAKEYLRAATAYDQAARAAPNEAASKDHTEQAKKLRHDYYVKLGQELLTTSKIKEAQAAFVRAQEVMDTEIVRAKLERIQDIESFRSSYDAGRSLQRRGDYEGALEKLLAAAKFREVAKQLRSDKSLDTNIRECRYQIHVRRAAAMRGGKQWDEAVAAYGEARRVDPARGAEIDAMIQQVDNERSYDESYKAADKARTDKNWDLFHKKIKELRGNPAKNAVQVQALFTLGQYQKSFDQATTAMEAKQYRLARAHAMQASKYKDTEEVKRLIKAIQEALGEGDGP